MVSIHTAEVLLAPVKVQGNHFLGLMDDLMLGLIYLFGLGMRRNHI